MGRGRLVTYCVFGLFFFSAVFTYAYLFFPEFRNGAHLFAGVILGQFVAAIIGLAAKDAVTSSETSSKEKDKEGTRDG